MTRLMRLLLLTVVALAPAAPCLAQVDPAYLAEDAPDVVLSDEIRRAASELGFEPVRIYEFVRNSFEYQPYSSREKQLFNKNARLPGSVVTSQKPRAL